MLEWIFSGIGLAMAGGLVVLLVSSYRYPAEQKARFHKLVSENGWSLAPTHPDLGKHDHGNRHFEVFGKTSTGLDWEIYLRQGNDDPDQMIFRIPALKLPQLELVLTPKLELSKLQEAVPTIESLANSFMGKMIMRLAESASARLGATPQDLLAFLKQAEEKPAGSSDFQARFSLLTRGGVPMEKVLTPETEAIIRAWSDRQFRLLWGLNGVQFQIHVRRSEYLERAPELLRLGELLTGGVAAP